MIGQDADNEKELLLQVAGGDEKAFGRLFYAYYPQLARHVFHLTDSMEMAEEIVQDVFLKIWMTRETLSDIQNFRSFVFVVSKNHTLNALKKVISERTHKQAWEKEIKLNPSSAEEENIREIQFSLIDHAIHQLPPRQKEIFILSRRDRMKYEEIAKKLGIARTTVKSHLQAATAAIADYIKKNIDKVLLLPLLLNTISKKI